MDLKKVLGNNIKHYRQLRGLSQEEFSELLDLSQQTLSRIERGVNFLTSETLDKIPHILGVNVYELFKIDSGYVSNDVMDDIERHLNVLKAHPQKLEFVRKIIRDITFL